MGKNTLRTYPAYRRSPTHLPNDAIHLVHHKNSPVRPHIKPHIRPPGWSPALRAILLLNQLEQRLCRAVIVKQNPPDRILPAMRQMVRIDIENLPARIVAK